MYDDNDMTPFQVLMALLFVGAVSVWAFLHWFDLPVVYFSSTSGECTKVESPKNEFSCENLPKKYRIDWSK